LARKGKGRKQPKQQSQGLSVRSFVFPGERASYWGGAAAVFVVFAVLAVIGYAAVKGHDGHKLWYVPLAIVAWPVLATIVCNVLAARQHRQAGRQAKVMATNHAELYRVLARQAGLLGFAKPPDMYIVDDGQPLIYSTSSGPGAVIASRGLRERLSADEVEALLARELTHLRCRHVRLELAMVYIRSSNPAIKAVFLPVLLMMLFARAWIELIEFTADRGALLVTLKPAVVNSAIVKLAVISDPSAGVTQAELEAFLQSSADIQTDAAQLERHFKVGQFISSQGGLRERIEQLTAYSQSAEGQQAIAKMAERQGVAPGSVAPVRTARVEAIEQVEDDEPVDSSPEL
jgi:Zn-dependent protease with chaperone function